MNTIKAIILFIFLYIWSVLISPIKCLFITYRKVRNRQQRSGSETRRQLGPPRFTGPSHDGYEPTPHKKRRRGHRGGKKHKRHFH